MFLKGDYNELFRIWKHQALYIRWIHDYLQKKHGIGKYDYMTKSWNKNTKCTRTKEGLIAHHKYENCAIMLSKKEIAMSNLFEWQLANNIVYCDYLEHLLLHVLICENPSEEKNDFKAVGIGGVINFIVQWDCSLLWITYKGLCIFESYLSNVFTICKRRYFRCAYIGFPT